MIKLKRRFAQWLVRIAKRLDSDIIIGNVKHNVDVINYHSKVSKKDFMTRKFENIETQSLESK